MGYDFEPTSCAPDNTYFCVHPLNREVADAGRCGPTFGRCNPHLGREGLVESSSGQKWCNVVTGVCGSFEIPAGRPSTGPAATDEYDFEPFRCKPDNTFGEGRRLQHDGVILV